MAIIQKASCLFITLLAAGAAIIAAADMPDPARKAPVTPALRSPLPEGALAKSGGETGYGAHDFVPSAERPVGFRINNAWYPGATPPTEWYDMPAAEGEKARPSKNIRWKVKLPGWSLAHPIVVGNRVFAVGDPDWVVCFDAGTGEELWKKRITIPLVNGLDEDEAANVQTAIDLGMALHYATTMDSGPVLKPGQGRTIKKRAKLEGEKRAAFLKEMRVSAARLIAMLEKHRPTVVASKRQALVTALDKDLAMLRGLTESNDDALFTRLTDGSQLRCGLLSACEREFKTSFRQTWRGYIGLAESTLASDGERIYGGFMPGQAFCLDLDGRVHWLRQAYVRHGDRGWWMNFAVLCDDVLVVHGARTDKNGHVPLLGLDKRTGEERWRVGDGIKGDGSKSLVGGYAPPLALRLQTAGGKPVAAIVTTKGGAVLRAADGQVLGTYEAPKIPTGQHLHALDGRLFVGGTHNDRGNGAGYAFDLALDAPDKVVATKAFDFNNARYGHKGALSMDPFPAASDRVIVGESGKTTGLYSPEDGRLLGGFGMKSHGWVIAGQYLVGLDMEKTGKDNQPYGRSRGTAASAEFATVDISVPTAPHVVGRGTLGFLEPAPDIILDEYLKAFDPFDFLGCYRGAASYFGGQMGGVVPQGDRLYIQSAAFLYCIADDLQGRLQDDPAIVERIRAATGAADLIGWFASDVPQYRYEALRRCITLTRDGAALDLQDQTERLRALAQEDAYATIRLEALRVLGLGPGEPGIALIVADLLEPKKWHGPTWDGRAKTWGRNFSILGDDAVPAILELLGDRGNPSLRRRVADCLVWMPGGTPALRDGLLAMAKTDDAGKALAAHIIAGVKAFGGWRLDPAVRAFMQEVAAGTGRAPRGFPDPVKKARQYLKLYPKDEVK